MRYRNKRTGVVIDVRGKVSGGDWEEVKPAPAPRKPKAPAADKKK